MALYRDYDRAGLDAQYFLRGRVPEHPEYFRRWAEDSAAVRRMRPCRLDLRYDVEALDLFPAGKTPAPCLLFIHGGYWQALDKSDFSFLAPVFQDAGVTVAVVNYTLAPKAAWTRSSARTARRWRGSIATPANAASIPRASTWRATRRVGTSPRWF